VTDPVSKVFGYSGNLSYRGVEATLGYDFLRNWRLTGAVLRLWARQDSPVQPLIDGRTPENTPQWNGNASLAYRIPEVPGLSVRGGIKVISQRPANPQNTGFIPGYVLYDAGALFATRLYGHFTSFQLVADNLSNRRYWNSVQTGTYGIGMDRTVRFNMRVDL